MIQYSLILYYGNLWQGEIYSEIVGEKDTYEDYKELCKQCVNKVINYNMNDNHEIGNEDEINIDYRCIIETAFQELEEIYVILLTEHK